MNSIAGVLSIDEGDILLDGQSIKKASVDERSKDISRVFQDPRMGTATNLSIEENMAIAIVVARNVASLKSLSLKVNVKYSRKPW